MPYIFQSGTRHPGRYTLETSRPGGGPLAALANLRLMGIEGFQALLGHLVSTAETLREHLEAHASTTVLNHDNFGPVTLFRVYPDGVDTFSMPEREMHEAGENVYSELKNLIVWAKDNGGMGTFYRSRHELIFAYKNGTAPHVNSFELGQHGRYRTNVWQYPGVNSVDPRRRQELEMHPTTKPTALVADAMRDCSRRKHRITVTTTSARKK